MGRAQAVGQETRPTALEPRPVLGKKGRLLLGQAVERTQADDQT